MIWSDQDIKRELNAHRIHIEPFDELAVQPASIDLRLGNVFWQFRKQSWLSRVCGKGSVIDVLGSVKPLMHRFEAEQVVLGPQQFLLGCTQERVSLNHEVIARVEGKSSLGRIGLSVHCTAGFIDPGNTDLSITLELFNQSPLPIILRPGMWICQLAFQFLLNPCEEAYGNRRASRYFGSKETEPSAIHLKSGL